MPGIRCPIKWPRHHFPAAAESQASAMRVGEQCGGSGALGLGLWVLWWAAGPGRAADECRMWTETSLEGETLPTAYWEGNQVWSCACPPAQCGPDHLVNFYIQHTQMNGTLRYGKSEVRPEGGAVRRPVEEPIGAIWRNDPSFDPDKPTQVLCTCHHRLRPNDAHVRSPFYPLAISCRYRDQFQECKDTVRGSWNSSQLPPIDRPSDDLEDLGLDLDADQRLDEPLDVAVLTDDPVDQGHSITQPPTDPTTTTTRESTPHLPTTSSSPTTTAATKSTATQDVPQGVVINWAATSAPAAGPTPPSAGAMPERDAAATEGSSHAGTAPPPATTTEGRDIAGGAAGAVINLGNGGDTSHDVERDAATVFKSGSAVVREVNKATSPRPDEESSTPPSSKAEAGQSEDYESEDGVLGGTVDATEYDGQNLSVHYHHDYGYLSGGGVAGKAAEGEESGAAVGTKFGAEGGVEAAAEGAATLEKTSASEGEATETGQLGGEGEAFPDEASTSPPPALPCPACRSGEEGGWAGSGAVLWGLLGLLVLVLLALVGLGLGHRRRASQRATYVVYRPGQRPSCAVATVPSALLDDTFCNCRHHVNIA